MKSGTFHILIGIDFSESSTGALYHGISLAERLGAVLHLAHITPMSASLSAPTDLGLNVPAEFKDAQRARQRLERMRAMIGSNLNVELHLRMGDAVRELLELAKEIRPDMLVVGSHGFGAVMRLLMGSVSTQLTRLSSVPVLVVPAPGREAAAKLEPDSRSEEPPLPTVGRPLDATIEAQSAQEASRGALNLNPPGAGGADVNPELRIRY